MRYMTLPQADLSTRIGRQFAAGQLVVTGTSAETGAHLTIRMKARKRNTPGKTPRWIRSSVAQADMVFLEEKHTGQHIGQYSRDKDGVLRYQTLAVAGPRLGALEWLCEQVISQATTGKHSDRVALVSADSCGMCSRQLTDPVSIERGIGPDCLASPTGSHYAKVSEAGGSIA